MGPACCVVQQLIAQLTGYGEVDFEVKNLKGSFKGWKGCIVLVASLDRAKSGVGVDVPTALKKRDAEEEAVPMTAIAG